MGLGPIEIVTLVFPGSHFNGDVLPELTKLVASGVVRIADGVFARRNDDGSLESFEIDNEADSAIGELGTLISDANGLLSDDDVQSITNGLEPGSSAVILVFEHTWVVPLRDAIAGSGGYLLESVRVPGPVVDEVLAAIRATA
jgi:uncharacterized membrane protein